MTSISPQVHEFAPITQVFYASGAQTARKCRAVSIRIGRDCRRALSFAGSALVGWLWVKLEYTYLYQE